MGGRWALRTRTVGPRLSKEIKARCDSALVCIFHYLEGRCTRWFNSWHLPLSFLRLLLEKHYIVCVADLAMSEVSLMELL